MQKIISASRLFILLALSCSLLMVWEYNSLTETTYRNSEIAGWDVGTNASLLSTLSADQLFNRSIEEVVTKLTINARAVPNTMVAAPNATIETKPVVKPVDTIWTSIGHDLKLNHNVQSSQVKAEIRRITRDPAEFNRILTASSPYIYYIYQQTQARKLPAELAFVPYIESEYNPNDHTSMGSRGAIGIWQLMPGTARGLGVTMRAGYDGRRNIVESTKAALLYYKDLGNLFHGNWYLAIAAYNCGEGRVQSAVRRAGSTNFTNLYSLPRDTKFYVPRLMAIAEIVKNPKKYGIKLPNISNAPYFTQTTTTKTVVLSQFAKTTGISYKTLQKLNPDYYSVVPKAKTLLVPVKS